jgi:tripartite-type tricarboxylate transporter receptor subunit TctC
MGTSRKTSHLFLILCLTVLCFYADPGHSQDDPAANYPTRPISFIVPNPPGGSTDLVFRLLVKEAEKHLGQPIGVINKPGAALALGVAAISGAKPDGYTIGFAPFSALYVVPHIEKVPYHPLKDLRYIVRIALISVGVVVKSDSPLNTFEDLIAFARKNPKKLTYGTTGTNSMQNIIMEQIAKKEGVAFTHIPYKGGMEWQTAILGGHIIAGAGAYSYSFLEAKQLRLLAFFSEGKNPDFPQVPILKELGYDIPCPMFFNVVTPKGIPDGIAKKLEDAFSKAIAEPAFVKKMREDLHEPIAFQGSKDLTEYVNHSYAVWERYLREAGVIK